MNEINIDSLSLKELTDLNKLIVDRIKYLRDMESMKGKVLFKIGEEVGFEHYNRYIIGNVVKINIKTISVETEFGDIWRVYPYMLKKIIKNY